jgi:hypothetical protein
LDTLDGEAELIEDIGLEIFKSGYSIRFMAQGKGPHIVGEIINSNKIVFESSKTCNWRCPQITMNYLKGKRRNRMGMVEGKPYMVAFLTSITQGGDVIFIVTGNMKSGN